MHLDSDYHTEDEIRERYLEAIDRGVNLHVWGRKEIENFLVHPKAILRVLASRVKGNGAPNEADLLIKILEICEEQRSSVEDGFAPAIMQANRKLEVISANKSARKRVHEIWRNEKDRATIVSEKYLLGKLSEWTQKDFGVLGSRLGRLQLLGR